MTSIRRLLGLFVTIALVGFALPATAAKQYTLNMSSSPAPLVAGVAGQAASMKLNNISSDTGNSNASSFKLVAGNGITIKTPASGTGVPLGGGYTATIQNNGSSIYVSNIQLPLKPFGPSLVLNMTVDVSCTATGANWNMLGVWTGSGFTGQTFAFTNTPPNTSNPNTPVTGICGSIAFVSQPADAFTNSQITTAAFNSAGTKVQVVVKANNVPASGVTPTVTSSCSGVTGTATASDANGLSTLTLSSGATAQANPPGCTITASAAGGYGSTGPSNAFAIVLPAGILGCEDSNNRAGNPNIDPTGDLVYTGTADYSLIRATTPGCTPIPYTFNLDPANKKFSFVADKGNPAQPLLVEYIVLWNPETPTSADGYPTDYHLLLAWGFGVFPPANYFTPSLPCKQDVLAFSSLPTIPSVEPFITLSGGGLTQYTPNTTAAMCQAAHGWGAVGPLSGPQVQFADKVIDTDGFGKVP